MNDLVFNSEDNKRFLNVEEIEYYINMVRYNPTDFKDIDILRPLFNKALNTLEKVMDELLIGNLFDKISMKILEINIDITFKILVRIKFML